MGGGGWGIMAPPRPLMVKLSKVCTQYITCTMNIEINEYSFIYFNIQYEWLTLRILLLYPSWSLLPGSRLVQFIFDIFFILAKTRWWWGWGRMQSVFERRQKYKRWETRIILIWRNTCKQEIKPGGFKHVFKSFCSVFIEMCIISFIEATLYIYV